MGSEIAGVRSTSSASTAYELLSRASAANPTGTAITYLEDADTLSTSKLTRSSLPFELMFHQKASINQTPRERPLRARRGHSTTDKLSIIC
jgi:hypothetical protein